VHVGSGGGVRLGWLPMTRRHLELSISRIDALANFRDVFSVSVPVPVATRSKA
jgi:hypothetical protein